MMINKAWWWSWQMMVNSHSAPHEPRLLWWPSNGHGATPSAHCATLWIQLHVLTGSSWPTEQFNMARSGAICDPIPILSIHVCTFGFLDLVESYLVDSDPLKRIDKQNVHSELWLWIFEKHKYPCLIFDKLCVCHCPDLPARLPHSQLQNPSVQSWHG